MWPIYICILNLPASVRTKAKNIILSSLWIGVGKPSFHHLLEPLLAEINYLTTVGMEIELPTGNVTVKAKLVLGIFDLPAKASILSCTQFNGYYGCSVCLHPGKQMSRRMVYPPRETSMRTHDQIRSFAQEAIECGKPKKGIKCISPLADYLNLVDSVPVDYMHAILEGVMSKLMNLWFQSSNCRKPYYLNKRKLRAIDCLLLRQTPPDDFSRAPRCIASHRKYWKATELKQWLLYYSLPLLQSKLPPLYWHHYSLLVCTMHILLKDEISSNELQAVEIMVKDFLNLFPILYGQINCTHNVHLISHLTRYVKLWGPLWTHSSFCFENKNGLIKSLFHGTNDIGQQILFNVSAQCTVNSLSYDVKLSDGDMVASYLTGDNNFKSNMFQIAEHVYAVGKIELVRLTKDQQDALQFQTNGRAETFYRLHKFGVMYHCTQYTRQTCSKRNNTFCQYRRSGTNHFGKIVLFVKYPKPCALIEELVPYFPTLSQQAGFINHPKLTKHQRVDLLSSIMPTVSRGRLVSIDLTDIFKKAVLMKVGSKEYICSIPNSYEHH